MQNQGKNHEVAVLATFRAVLDSACESGLTTRKAIGMAAEADDEMVRRWLSGQWPALRKFRRLISLASLLPPALKRQLIDWFLRGSCFAAVDASPVDRAVLDANGDGIVDERDTTNHIAHAVKGIAEAIEVINHGRLSIADRATVRQMLYGCRDNIDSGIATIDEGQTRSLRVG